MTITHQDELEALRKIGRVVANTMQAMAAAMEPGMTTQELDRYQFRSPGQAGSYFYGYARLMELRVEAELALGDKFDRLAFNNFLLDQGLLPPDQLAAAVNEVFVPAQRRK